MLADLPTAPWFRRVLVAALILGIVLLTFSVLRPFVVPLIWGGILAYVSWPMNQRFLRLVRGRASVASLLTTISRNVICGSAGVCAWINARAPITATVIAANTRPMLRN